MTEITNTDKAGSVVTKANANFASLGSSASLQQLSIDDKADAFVSKLNANFAAVVDGGGGGTPSVDGETTIVYDLVNVGGKGVSVTYYPCAITAGKTYRVRRDSHLATPSSTTYYIVKTYDANKNVVQTFIDSSNNKIGLRWGEDIVATGNAVYIGIQAYSGYNCTVEHDDTWSNAVAKANPLYNKKWLLVGDSISTESGQYATVGYGKIIAGHLGLHRYNVAVSGKTTSYFLNDTDWANYRNDFDIITVMLGTNDNGYHSVTASGYANNCKSLYDTFHAKWPNADIIFITPIKRWPVTGNFADLYAYVDALKAMCAQYNIPCIDIYYDETWYKAIDPTTEDARTTYFIPGSTESENGTHPNDLGQSTFLAPRIEQWIINNYY